jgi:hypothetical protein
MAETESKITAPKLLAFIGMLLTLALGIAYFYAAAGNPLNILWGIICLLIVFLIFVSLELINFGPLKIPYKWWIILIYGIVLVLFAYFFGTGFFIYSNYFPAIILLLAALIEVLMQKKPYKASKMVLLVGIGFSIYECFMLFLYGNALFIVNGVFGLILLVLLIIVLFDLVDLKVINYVWWVVLLIGFVIFMWVSPYATGIVTGFGGTLILIAFVLMVLAL